MNAKKIIPHKNAVVTKNVLVLFSCFFQPRVFPSRAENDKNANNNIFTGISSALTDVRYHSIIRTDLSEWCVPVAVQSLPTAPHLKFHLFYVEIDSINSPSPLSIRNGSRTLEDSPRPSNQHALSCRKIATYCRTRLPSNLLVIGIADNSALYDSTSNRVETSENRSTAPPYQYFPVSE